MIFDKYNFFKSFFYSLSVLDRYIAGELIFVFLFGVSMFSSVGVAVGTLSELMNKIFEFNLPLVIAVKVLLLKTPEFISYSFPISILLATLITYGRLSNDSELVALRSVGISLYRLVIPALFLSVVVMLITFLFNELVVPTANYQASYIQNPYIPNEKLFLQKQHILYPEYGKNQKIKSLFYASGFDGKKMIEPIVMNWSGSKLEQIIISNSATWNFQQNIWDFWQGRIYQISASNSYDKIKHFSHQQLQFSKAPLDLVSKYRDPYEMNIAQANKYLKILKFSGDRKQIIMFQVRTQQKIAFPFVCLIFGIVGATLGSRPRTTSKATSFGISVGIVFIYYLLSFLTGALGLVNILSPFMAAWLPNFFGLGVGVWLLGRTAQ